MQVIVRILIIIENQYCRIQILAGMSFFMADERFRSPINIDMKKTVVLIIQKPLKYNGYDALPSVVTMENTGDTGEESSVIF